jgi:molybdopterin-synthase adenylyltransferase
VIDDDVVSLSNLQRQIIHATETVGRPKVESARQAIAAINPNVKVEAHQARLTAENVDALVAGYDVVVDGSDNFDTRYLLADACQRARPLVAGALGRFDGSLTVLKPYEFEADGRRNPSYRDLFPEPPPAGLVPSCAEAGIVGALAGVIGTLQAVEVVKLVTGIGDRWSAASCSTTRSPPASR